MKREQSIVVYDDELQVEAYHLIGLEHGFPEHFHKYYVLGLIEQGQRNMVCNGESTVVQSGDIIIFNPGDNHSCVQISPTPLTYRSFNISVESLRFLLGLADDEPLPIFRQKVIRDDKITDIFRECHSLVLANSEENGETGSESDKEELFLLLLSFLAEAACADGSNYALEQSSYDCEIAAACNYMEEHFAENISLDTLCRQVNVSKSTLIRYFIRLKNMTPYRYLASVRVGKAKQMLERGDLPIDVAGQAGFADQSHFNHCFKKFIGISPGMYREMFINKKIK